MNNRPTDKQAQGASNREWGALAEKIATEYLIRQDYTIRERNFRLGHLEVDIIAQKGNEIVFVEVKARTGENQDPLDAVNKEKRKNMAKVADTYLNSQQQFYWYRFDIITLTGTPEHYTIDHYPDAFLPPLSTRIHPRTSRISNRHK